MFGAVRRSLALWPAARLRSRRIGAEIAVGSRLAESASVSASQRRSERIWINLKVRWIRDGITRELSAIDMNQHGMFLVTDEVIRVGNLLRIEALVPNGPIIMFVKVRFVGFSQSCRGMGVELSMVDSKYRALWGDFYSAKLAAFKARMEPIVTTTAEAA